MKKIIILFLISSAFCYSEYDYLKGVSQIAFNYQPKDYIKRVEEAVDYLEKYLNFEQKNELKNSFNFSAYLFDVNFNDVFGKAGNNKMLLDDCMKKTNYKNSPFSEHLCFSFFTKELWHKLNKDILLIDLENSEPKEYFKQLNKKIEINIKANKLRNFLAFPVWIFDKKKTYPDFKDFKQNYYDYAFKNYKNKSNIQYLLLLYLSYYSKDNEIVPFWETFFNSNEIIILPINTSNSIRSLFDYDNCKISKKPVSIEKIKMSDFAFACLNSTIERNYKNIQEYLMYKKIYQEKEYLNYTHNVVFNEKLIDELLNTPNKLFKIILLTRKVIYDAQIGFPEKRETEFFNILYKKLETKLKNFKEPTAIGETDFKEYIKKETKDNNYDFKYLTILKYLLLSISDDELLKMISEEEYNKHKEMYKDYYELPNYKQLISFIIKYESNRIFKLLGKEKFYTLIELYFINQNYSFYSQTEYLDLLYKTDLKRFEDNYIYNNFVFDKEDKTKEPITQVFFMEYLFDKDIDKYKLFIKDWLIFLGCKENYYHKQTRIFLSILKNGNEQFKVFYNELLNDKNFIKCKDE